jgi:type II secretory pathway pseudopilin PulG
MKGFVKYISNHRGFTLLEILLAAGMLLGALVYLTRIFYGVGSISADSRLQMEQIIIAQSAMEIVVAGILDDENLPTFKGEYLTDNVRTQMYIVGSPGSEDLVGNSGITVEVWVYRTDNANANMKDFKIEVIAKHPYAHEDENDNRNFKLTHYLLGV